MRDVLHFWRDVEIFNIPDAPTAKKPAQSGSATVPDDGETDLFPDSDDVTADASDASEAEVVRPRVRVVQRFAAGGDASLTDSPLLPWCDPRFQVPEKLPVPSASTDTKDGTVPPPAAYAHAIYLGVGPKQRFVDFILRTHSLAPTFDEIHRPASGQGWLAGFIVDQHGLALEKTYTAASFTVGSGMLRDGRSLDGISNALQVCTMSFDDRMETRRAKLALDQPSVTGFPLTWSDLIDEWALVHEPLGGIEDIDDEGPLGPFIVIQSVPLFARGKDRVLNPAPNQAATFLNSFYLDDLTALIQGGPDAFSAALLQYLGQDSALDQRQDLLADPRSLADLVRPKTLAAGRWASSPNEPLALAQQAAVYQTLDRIGQQEGERSRGLMSVNGPPGTGKTTLLKDIIAEVVVQRAKRISQLDDPNALFTHASIQTSGKIGDARTIRADIAGDCGIVVTSSNNAAVQNISFELPFSCDRDAFPDAAYLPEVAAAVAEAFKLPRKNPWGFLAGALGAKANREKIANTLMGYEKAVALHPAENHPVIGQASSLKPWLDLARKQNDVDGGKKSRARWDDAKADFLSRSDEVATLCDALAELDEAMRALQQLPADRHEISVRRDTLRTAKAALQDQETARLSASAQDVAQNQAAQQQVEAQYAAQNVQYTDAAEKLKEVRDLTDPGWLARGMKKLIGWETQAYKQWKDAVQQARAALDSAKSTRRSLDDERNRLAQQATTLATESATALQAYNAKSEDLTARITYLNTQIARLDEREVLLQEKVAASRNRRDEHDGPRHLPDEAFFALSSDDQHRSSLWVSARLDRARSELFLAALRLHEATLMATASAWFTVLRVVREVLGGQSQALTPKDLAAVWDSLFFIVPVVSTTLASFGRLFQGMGRESLGWVLIDEAGQAPPASVAGALGRARRAVIVGDPLQIEPVVTVPQRLVQRLGENVGMDGTVVRRWSPSVQSAQTIADRTMVLGAMVGDVWTGLPLRTHRRCMSPMFEIANRIAYDDQMVQATGSKAVAPDLSASGWIDVSGTADGKVVGNEIAVLSRILDVFLQDWPTIVNKKGEREAASVYVISPFRDVAQACRDRIGPDSTLGRKFAKQKRVVDAGTVHTFQGKEASIVFMVLGSAPGAPGAGSRSWAASKPNLLNVAVTRAQQRFYVIGCYADWAALPYFSEMSEKAGHMRRLCFEMAAHGEPARLVPVSAAATH